MSRSLVRLLFASGFVASLLAATACGRDNAASKLAKTPTVEGDFAARCATGKRDDKPLIVALSSSDKLAMEARMRGGPLVVRYEGCELELLSRCKTKAGAYRYTGGTLKKDSLSAKNEDELFAKLPVGGPTFAGKVKSEGKISVATATVGRFDSDAQTPARSDLEGDCSGATHWVTGVTVGAYRMASGAEAEVAAEAALFGAAAGGRSSSARESLSQDGDGAACEKATDGDVRPPPSCGALLRLELTPLAGAP